ncbi:hypothetical protein GCM10011492_39130 [Flexivirga endophytica]|uniref:Polyketide cyclase n=1 Tax=Flexivirga endophytica TaxID=1849103 RepID=A0A916TJC3_9MICO|nr:SRPBCC family protein [Flexivirga endophytica]GGB44228.1 hypothetical protein GCM10011492_39130 [Flexivirga endophytica]GHB60135.1 hypothetical protein GCM10008112_31330 [Flexivirga endophytica]
MTATEETKVVSATLEMAAPAPTIFEVIADPSRQPAWDGNDNLAEAAPGQRVHGVGEIFRTRLTNDSIRDNLVVEFEEGRRIAWCPSNEGQPPAGHLWRWELEQVDESRTLVTHTYDWSQLHDAKRVERARSTTPDKLSASLEKLAATVESV